MPSNPKIPKEMILEYTFKILLRDGYEKINIKGIAKEIGCSTQPISWHFGNMDGLKVALLEYAREYALKRLLNIQENAMLTFLELGVNYIDIAIEEPNLFCYLFMNGGSGCITDDIKALSEVGQSGAATEQISEQLGIPKEVVSIYVRDLLIYAHGLASYVATGVLTISKEEAKEMLTHMGKMFFEKK